MLKHIGQHHHITRLVGQCLQRVARRETQIRMTITLLRGNNVLRIEIEAMHRRASDRHDVIGKRAVPTTDIDHTLPRIDILDKEIVVARQTVLCMNAGIVLNSLLSGQMIERRIEPEDQP